MKNLITILFLLIKVSANAQSLPLSSFVSLSKLKSNEEKYDYLYGRGFIKESKPGDLFAKFYKKKFNKQWQSFDYEIITIAKDSTTYSLSNPKSFVKFKNKIGEYLLKKKIKIYETNEDEEFSTPSKKLYNFTYYDSSLKN